MKKLVYVFIVLFGLIAASCTEEAVNPQREGDDDPISILLSLPKPNRCRCKGDENFHRLFYLSLTHTMKNWLTIILLLVLGGGAAGQSKIDSLKAEWRKERKTAIIIKTATTLGL